MTSPAQTRSHSAASSSARSDAAGAAARSWVQKLAPCCCEVGPDGVVQRPVRPLRRLDPEAEQRQLVGEVQPDPAVVGADRAGADPHDVAGGAQLVEIAAAVAEPGAPGAPRSPASTPRAPRPAAARAPRPAPRGRGARRGCRARPGGSGRRPPARPARPRGAASPANAGAAGAARRRRTTPGSTPSGRNSPCTTRSVGLERGQRAGDALGRRRRSGGRRRRPRTGRGCGRSGRPATRAGAAPDR